MNATTVWSDIVPEKDGVKSSINDIAVSPDGTRVVVAVGSRVLLYNGENGDLIESLRGHKETVYSVDFSHDGSRFASGGADNIVVIWKSSGQGLLKYTHGTPVQRVKYSPTAIKLASCSEVDFGIWTPEQMKVLKEKINSRILSAAWTLDGSALALGTVSGVISIRNHNAEEISRIERKAPVWCLLFITGSSIAAKQPSTPSSLADAADVLVCGCWSKNLSFYKQQNGTYKLHNEKNIGFYPCSISVLGPAASKSSYLVVSGSNKKATMFSKDGVRLADVAKKDSWVWGCACSPSGDKLVVGTDSGSIEALRMDFVNVHALYRDRYAYRENLTEIIVHHLVQDRKVRIKCKDLIRHISLYKNKLAVHLTDRVCIYESNTEDSVDMHFRVRKERMTLRPSTEYSTCDHMAVMSSHVLFCTKNVMELYSFDGVRQRVWMLESTIRYIKVDGGPDGREGVLVGLESGTLHKIYIQTPFPIDLAKCKSAVICADMSLDKMSLATVDSTGFLSVINLKTQEVLFSTTGVSSVCFNTEVSNVICYSSDKSIFVVSGLGSTVTKPDGSVVLAPIEPQEQYISGAAIGFQGQRIYCIYRGSITSIDVPQGKYMLKALDAGDPKAAYAIACLGVTESDWKLLAMRALRSNAISVAKNAFSRLKDMKFLGLIEQIERVSNNSASTDNAVIATSATTSAAGTATSGISGGGGRQRGNGNNLQNSNANGSGSGSGINIKPTSSQLSSLDAMWNAELLAYEGHHSEASKTYARMNKIEEAIRVFTDMRLWEDAIMLSRNAGRSDVTDLRLKQAHWFQETNDWKSAAELFVSLGNHMEAAKVVAENATSSNQWQSVMTEVARSTPAENIAVLQFCGEYFSNAGEDALAREAFIKLGDISKLMQLYAKRQLWAEAAKLADEHEGKFDASVFLPYAEWLISKDRFDEAMAAYKKAQRVDLAQAVLHKLTKNAVLECRFKDAAYYYWMLSKESDGSEIAAQSQYELKADLYYAYSSIHSFVTDPFTSHQPEMLFQVARFILNSLGNSETAPQGISKASTLYTLARHSMTLGTFKLARLAFDRLTKLRLPRAKQDEIELDMMVVQAKPVRDSVEHLPVCYRCGSTNPLLNPFTSKFAKADVCTNCGHPFVRSFINFDVLPLVEFVPEPSISDDEAIELIRQSKGEQKRNLRGDSGWREGKEGDAEFIRFDGDYDDDHGFEADDKIDLFTRCLNKTLDRQTSTYIPVTVDANTLIHVQRSEIYVCRPSSKNKRATFYKNMLPDISIAISQPCHRFFHLEDFEFAYLSNKGCPFSRVKNVGEYGSL